MVRAALLQSIRPNPRSMRSIGLSHSAGEKLETLLKRPTDAMSQGGMQPVDLKDDKELKALIVYVESLR
jgi:cytochrome c2